MIADGYTGSQIKAEMSKYIIIKSLDECIKAHGNVFGPIRYHEQFADINDVQLGNEDLD